MNATSGLLGLSLSRPADHLSFSGNKSPAPMSSERLCKGCGSVKLLTAFRKHNRGGRRWTCRSCENKWVRTTKPWNSDAKRTYQRHVYQTRRGMRLVCDAKLRAKKKNLPFSIDWRDIQTRIERGLCEVTGLPFDLNARKTWNAPSLDQIVPGGGYTPENVRVVLYAVNVMASNWGLEMILKMAAAIQKGGQ